MSFSRYSDQEKWTDGYFLSTFVVFKKDLVLIEKTKIVEDDNNNVT